MPTTKKKKNSKTRSSSASSEYVVSSDEDREDPPQENVRRPITRGRSITRRLRSSFPQNSSLGPRSEQNSKKKSAAAKSTPKAAKPAIKAEAVSSSDSSIYFLGYNGRRFRNTKERMAREDRSSSSSVRSWESSDRKKKSKSLIVTYQSGPSIKKQEKKKNNPRDYSSSSSDRSVSKTRKKKVVVKSEIKSDSEDSGSPPSNNLVSFDAMRAIKQEPPATASSPLPDQLAPEPNQAETPPVIDLVDEELTAQNQTGEANMIESFTIPALLTDVTPTSNIKPIDVPALPLHMIKREVPDEIEQEINLIGNHEKPLAIKNEQSHGMSSTHHIKMEVAVADMFAPMEKRKRGRPRKYPPVVVVKPTRKMVKQAQSSSTGYFTSTATYHQSTSSSGVSSASNNSQRSLPSSSNTSFGSNSPPSVHLLDELGTMTTIPFKLERPDSPVSAISHMVENCKLEKKPRKILGVPVKDALPFLTEWFQKDPMFVENGRSELAMKIGWSKYRIRKWFSDEKIKHGIMPNPPKSVPTMSDAAVHTLETIFKNTQFVNKDYANKIGAEINVPGKEVYSWFYHHRISVFDSFTKAQIFELPCQMRFLENAYLIKPFVEKDYAKIIMAETNTTLWQVSGYFRSRRHYDRMRGVAVPDECHIPLLHWHTPGIDFMIPDAHWEFSICRGLVSQFSSAGVFYGRPLDIEELTQHRVSARGLMFRDVPLPLSHSSFYNFWTTYDIDEFVCQFLSPQAAQIIRERGIESVHLKFFKSGDRRFYDKLVLQDTNDNVPPKLSWDEFLNIGYMILRIDDACKEWKAEYERFLAQVHTQVQ